MQEQPMKNRSRAKKGFQNLVPKTESLKSDFSRPHRKDLMQTILGKNFEQSERVTQRKKEALKTLKLAKQYSNINVSFSNTMSGREYNAMAGAMERGRPSKLKYQLGLPIKVPPNYEKKLRDLDKIGREFEKEIAKQKILEQEIERAKVTLKINSNAAGMVDKLTKADILQQKREARFKEEKEQTLQEKSANEEEDAVDLIVSELSSGSTPNTPQSLKSSTFAPDSKYNTSKESWSSRNVPYMLEIWKKSEQNTPFDEVKPRVGTSTLPPIGQKSRLIDETKESFHQMIGKPNSRDFVRLSEYPSYLSESTLEFLRRLSRDTSTQTPRKEDDFHVLQRTLTGFNPETGRLNIIETIENIQSYSSHYTKKISPFRGLTPGRCAKEISNFITDDGDILPFESNRVTIPSDHPFELIIPTTDPREGSLAYHSEEINHETNEAALDPKEVSKLITQQLVEQFGQNILIPIKGNNKFYEGFKSITINDEFETNAEDLSFQDLAEALRQFIVSGTCEETDRIKYQAFLDSDLVNLQSKPERNSKTWEHLVKFLVYCMGTDSNQAILFESVCCLSLLDAESTLLRWDRQLYRNTINKILNIGTNTQRRMASLAEVRSNNIDHRVIQQIWLDLGSFDRTKRNKSLSIISKLNIKFAKIIVNFLEKDSTNPNWRVRIDMVALLKYWVEKLQPPPPQKPNVLDPDILEYDDPQTIKALFPFGKSVSTQGLGEEHAAGSDQDAAHYYNPENLPLYEKCIALLLNLMSNDWSAKIRASAANTLGELKQGKAVLDHISNSMKSSDPVKRVNSLKCLSLLRVLSKDHLSTYLECLNDPFASVRIEACRFACQLKSPIPIIVNRLVDLLGDPDYKVRAYSVKAIGLSGNKSAIVRENIYWSLLHDEHAGVRAEAIQAVYILGLLKSDPFIRDGVLTLVGVDKSDVVRNHAETVLFEEGIIQPILDESNDATPKKADGSTIIPFPHILSDKSKMETDIFLRKALIEEKELSSVIEQVQELSTKDGIQNLLVDAEKKTREIVIEGIDLDYNSSYKPDTAKFHKNRTKETSSKSILVG